MSAAAWECMARVDACAKVVVWADTEDEALEYAADAWDYAVLDVSNVEVEWARRKPDEAVPA